MYKALFFLFLIFAVSAFSQSGPRTWQDHLSINSCNTLTKRGSTVYASYRNGLIKFDEKELSPQDLNKINGLSDLGIRLLRTNPYNNKLLVIYDNCNIDIIDVNEEIRNYPNIKLKSFNGKKIINEVTFDNQLAYLACGFGIVVFDTDKLEVKDTYIIGPNASNLEINQLAIRDSLIFAATPTGMYRANRSKILNNYKSWIYDTFNLPKGPYCGVNNIQGNVICCYTPSNEQEGINPIDTIYSFINHTWVKYPPLANVGHAIRKMGPTYGNLFSLIDPISLVVRNVNTGELVQHIAGFNGKIGYGTLRDAHIAPDHTGNINYWLADESFGLFQTHVYYDPYQKMTRNGMNKSVIGNIDVFEGKVAVSPSYINITGSGNYLKEGINILKEGEWSYLECREKEGVAQENLVEDITSVLFDRVDKTRIWVCSWYYGVLKYVNNKLTAVYTPGNTSMPGADPAGNAHKYEPRCTGLSMDKDGNVWFAHSDQKNYLSVIKRNGEYKNFTFDVSRSFIRRTFVDKNNYVWVLHERDGGITVFKHNNFSAPQQDVNYKWINNAVGTGHLESNTVYSIAEDKDGKIWIGTAAGISVIYNPVAIFSSSDYDAQPIKIVQDGNVELLLGKEAVTAIVVDGANNKWVGTELGGVYCFSPDGLRELYHFTKENSPLYSNTILDINYNEATGDLFFGTEAGLQSFRGIVVRGETEYKDVYAYPNPVKPNYQGTVLVRGLVDNSVVKITDESGNLVWETKSNGGQIEWPVKTFAGNRVSSGVYVIYATTIDGEMKAVTKILVVN